MGMGWGGVPRLATEPKPQHLLFSASPTQELQAVFHMGAWDLTQGLVLAWKILNYFPSIQKSEFLCEPGDLEHRKNFSGYLKHILPLNQKLHLNVSEWSSEVNSSNSTWGSLDQQNS